MGGWRGLRGFVLLCFRGGGLGAKCWVAVDGVAVTRATDGGWGAGAGPELPLLVEALQRSHGSSGGVQIAPRAVQQEAVLSRSWVSRSLASTASSWVT